VILEKFFFHTFLSRNFFFVIDFFISPSQFMTC